MQKLNSTKCVAGGSLKITGLTTKTTYYIKAFATDKDGLIFYGNELSFTTL